MYIKDGASEIDLLWENEIWVKFCESAIVFGHSAKDCIAISDACTEAYSERNNSDYFDHDIPEDKIREKGENDDKE